MKKLTKDVNVRLLCCHKTPKRKRKDTHISTVTMWADECVNRPGCGDHFTRHTNNALAAKPCSPPYQATPSHSCLVGDHGSGAKSPLRSLIPQECGASNHLLIPDPLGLTLGHRGFPCDLHPSVSPSSTFVPYADILRGSEYIKGNTATLPSLVWRTPAPLPFLCHRLSSSLSGDGERKGAAWECPLWGGQWDPA